MNRYFLDHLGGRHPGPVLGRVFGRLLGLLLSLGLALGVAHAAVPQAPEVAAKSYFLVDVTTGQVLAERDADRPADPASLTKLMTAWLVFDALKAQKISLSQTLTVSTLAWEERKGGGSLMFVEPRHTPTVDELLRGMIIVSGNDAAVVLAEGVGGSLAHFVDLMNRQAQAWGLKQTQFKNVTGLTESGHQSTARELAVIAQHLIDDFPDYYGTYYGLRNYTYNNIRQDNRNLLLGRDPSVDGMKTGYTDAAGYCLIASAQRDLPNGKRRLLSVVMGTASREARANESQKLLNWGFTAWDAVRLFEANKPVAQVPIWKGDANTVALGATTAVVVAVPRGEGDQIVTTLQRTDPLLAPLAEGQSVGTLEVTTKDGGKLLSVPMVALKSVGPAGWFGRLWDALRLWIK